MPAGSITGIESLDDIFLKHWGERRDHLYYITKFRNLKRENGQSTSNFTKIFNKMFSKIPAEIKLTLHPKSPMPMPLIQNYVFFLEREDQLLYHSCKILPLKWNPISLHLRILKEKFT